MKRVYLTVQCITYSFRVAKADKNILVLGYVLLQIKMKRVYLTVQCITYSFGVAKADKNILVLGYVF